MRRSHGRAIQGTVIETEGIGVSRQGGEHIDARRGNLHPVAIGGETGARVGAVCGGHGERMVRCAGILQIGVAGVPRGRDRQHIMFPGVVYGRLDGLRVAVAVKAHGDGLRARGDRVVNGRTDVGFAAVAGPVQNLIDHELQRKTERSHSGAVIGGGHDGPGGVCAMPVVVLPGARRRGYGGGHQRPAVAPVQLAALRRICGTSAGIHEVRVGAIDARIENGNFHAIGAGVGRGEVTVGKIAPCRGRLDGGQGPLLVEHAVVRR